MNVEPVKITLDQIVPIIAERFEGKDEINCYVGSNAATPTASIEALTESIKQPNLKLPFFKMVHLLLQGPVPYVEEGLQDRVMTYSIFSAGDVRKAANEGLTVAGSVMASDAFFPFRDGLDQAAEAGITAVIQPGGSMRDEEVIAAADEHLIAMVFTGMRHFRH